MMCFAIELLGTLTVLSALMLTNYLERSRYFALYFLDAEKRTAPQSCIKQPKAKVRTVHAESLTLRRKKLKNYKRLALVQLRIEGVCSAKS